LSFIKGTDRPLWQTFQCIFDEEMVCAHLRANSLKAASDQGCYSDAGDDRTGPGPVLRSPSVNANAVTAEQKEGLKLFMDKGCAGCHAGINVGGQMYAPFGVIERPGADILPPGDKGRFQVTKTVSDEYLFRVPPLRNVELTPPYFHSGKSWDLRQAVAVMGTSRGGFGHHSLPQVLNR
jgi:cytochrome c peroxidase